jgi:hypothetical protein
VTSLRDFSAKRPRIVHCGGGTWMIEYLLE